MDEYGRHPGDLRYKNKLQHDVDWIRHEMSKREWAKKRIGKSRAQIDEIRHSAVGDAVMEKYLEEEGLLSKSTAVESEAMEENAINVELSEPCSET
jgi:hypothetical protein